MMTAEQAEENVQMMRKKTKRPARIRLLELALNGFGKLSPDARAYLAKNVKRYPGPVKPYPRRGGAG